MFICNDVESIYVKDILGDTVMFIAFVKYLMFCMLMANHIAPASPW